MIGIFGGVVFDAAIYLTKEMKRGSSSEWAEHKVLNQIPVLERTGGELTTFSTNITFNKRHTLSFETGLALLESYAKSGAFFPLIIGLQVVGGFTAPNYVVTKVEADYGVVDNLGRGLHSTVQVEFKQYRVAVGSTLGGFSSLGGLGSALGQVASAVSAIPGVSAAITAFPGVSSLPVVSTVSNAITAAGGIVGAVNAIPNMIGSVTGKALAAIPATAGGTSSLLPAGVRI